MSSRGNQGPFAANGSKPANLTGVIIHTISPPTGRFFVKMQGLQNHFVIVDGRSEPYRPTTDEIVHICDVGRGVGADQLLVLEPPTTAGAAAGAYAFMRILNIDGMEVAACGNATRCFGWLMLEETGRDAILLETAVGPLRCKRLGDRHVSVEMGKITTDWASIPLAKKVDTTRVPVANGPLKNGVALNIGNPHIVFFVDDLSALDVATLAHPIQTDPMFPEKVNVGVAQVVDAETFLLSVYERPGILTTACGSGACVTLQAARLLGLTESRRARVQMAAGSVDITLDDRGHATMAGPVDFCFSGRLTGQEGRTA